MKNLADLIVDRALNRQELVDTVNSEWLPAVALRYNSEFGPRYFGRPPSEPIPTAKRLLTLFRTRLGSLLEYGMGTVWDSMLEDTYGRDLRLSFVVAHQYPDFLVRGRSGDPLLGLDAKFLHDESDEYSARFDRPIDLVNPANDFLWYGAWQWRRNSDGLEYPHVLETLMLPAESVAVERDRRLILTGGRFEQGVPVVPPNWSQDTNFGKIDRIVHTSRRAAEDLDVNVKALLDFTSRNAAEVQRASQGTTSDPEPTPDEIAPVEDNL